MQKLKTPSHPYCQALCIHSWCVHPGTEGAVVGMPRVGQLQKVTPLVSFCLAL